MGTGIARLLGRFLKTCANAIAYAHGHNVLEPRLENTSNIMLGETGETLVVDWGLAKLTGGPSSVRGRCAVAGVGRRFKANIARRGRRHAGVHEPGTG